MKKLNVLIISIKAFAMSLLLNSCVPIGGTGITPTPNEQAINIQMTESFNYNTETILTTPNTFKSIVVDGDSMYIQAKYVVKQIPGMASPFVEIAYLNFAFIIKSNANWFVATRISSSQDTNYANRISMCWNYDHFTFPQNTTIGDTTDISWESASMSLSPTEYINNSNYKTVIYQGGSTFGGPTFDLFYPGQSFYLVLKKQTATGNKYFSIKTTHTILYNLGNITSCTHKIVSIKNSNNSITTGQ